MAIMGFGVAVNDRRKNQQTGEWEDYPNFVDCTHVRHPRREAAALHGEGHEGGHRGQAALQLRGSTRASAAASWRSIVDEIEFMSSRPSRTPRSSMRRRATSRRPRAQAARSRRTPHAGSAAAERAAGLPEPACGPQQPDRHPHQPRAGSTRPSSTRPPATAAAAAPQQAVYDEDIPF